MNRKGLLSALAFICGVSGLSGQNLVLNPSFEYGEAHCEYTIEINSNLFDMWVQDWSLPSPGTSDVFSTLVDTSCWTHMPYSTYKSEDEILMGWQKPRTGNRFVGIYTYANAPFHYSPPSYREYVQGTLSEPLVPGETYCGEMYLSLGERSQHGANNIGMHFRRHQMIDNYWVGVPHGWYGIPIPEEPQIVMEEVLMDSVNWTRIAGRFVPEEPIGYVIIGNFKHDDSTEVIPRGGYLSWRPLQNGKAYYFIDDVSVKRYVADAVLTVTGAESVCSGDSTMLSATPGFHAYAWTTLADTTGLISDAPSVWIKPTSDMKYLLRAWNCDVILRDTLEVIVNPLPEIQMPPEVSICEGDVYVLDPGDYPDITWEDLSQDRLRNVTKAGVYTAQVRDNNHCLNIGVTHLTVNTVPVVDLGPDSLVCTNFYPLRVPDQYTSYAWSTGETTRYILPRDSGVYWLEVLNECGQTRDSLEVHSLEDLFIPNVVTPNGDRWNDSLAFKGIGNMPVKLSIANRWGQVIYSIDNYRNEWPEKENEPESGTYYYILSNGGCAPRKGWVQLIR